jgi:hypothetical protein
MNTDEMMVMYLIHNQLYIKSLIQPYTDQYEELLRLEDPIFIADIDKQYNNTVKWIIVRVLTEKTGATAEDAFILMESFHIGEYLT